MIGHVVMVFGEASVTHANGTVSQLYAGEPIYQGDVLQTAANSSLGITLNDATAFLMGPDARMMVAEFLYAPSASDKFGADRNV